MMSNNDIYPFRNLDFSNKEESDMTLRWGLLKNRQIYFKFYQDTNDLICVYNGVDIPSSQWNEKQWELYNHFHKLTTEKATADYNCSVQIPDIFSDFVKEIKLGQI